MGTLLENLKAVVIPKKFVDLGIYRRKSMVIYGFAVTFLIVLLCNIIPMQMELSTICPEIESVIEQLVPEFSIQGQKLTIDKNKPNMFQGPDYLIYYNTGIEKFTLRENSNDYVFRNIPKGVYDQVELGTMRILVISSQNLYLFEKGKIQELTIKELSNLMRINGQTFDKKALIKKVPDWMQLGYYFAYAFIYIGAVLSLFVLSSLYGIIGNFVNSMTDLRLSMSMTYATVVYIRIIVIAVKHILGVLKLDEHATIIGFGLTIIYMILAFVFKKQKDGIFNVGKMENNYPPNEPFYPDHRYYGNEIGDDMFSSKPFDPIMETKVKTRSEVEKDRVYTPSEPSEIKTVMDHSAEFFAQDEKYASNDLVWKPDAPAQKSVLAQPAPTSQEWKPQAQTTDSDDKRPRGPVWQGNPNGQNGLNQAWNPQGKTSQEERDYYGTSSGPTWNPKMRDNSNPTMANHNNTGTAYEDSQGRVWGKPEDR